LWSRARPKNDYDRLYRCPVCGEVKTRLLVLQAHLYVKHGVPYTVHLARKYFDDDGILRDKNVMERIKACAIMLPSTRASARSSRLALAVAGSRGT
jgi:hypothetical protein